VVWRGHELPHALPAFIAFLCGKPA